MDLRVKAIVMKEKIVTQKRLIYWLTLLDVLFTSSTYVHRHLNDASSFLLFYQLKNNKPYPIIMCPISHMARCTNVPRLTILPLHSELVRGNTRDRKN